LTKLGFKNIDAESLAKLNTDEYTEEMTLMADVRAYFSVSHKVRFPGIDEHESHILIIYRQRIIDFVPLTIDHTFLYALARSMEESLGRRLQVTSPELAMTYLSEDPEIYSERLALVGQRERLEMARKELISFGIVTRA
jgi:hypothetical protein